MEGDKGMNSNMLSAEELMRLGWQRDMALPLRGVKEYGPDGSWMVDKTLQVTLRERTGIIAEERVAKLGSLARGEWKPDVRKVHLVKNKKKFWQTMGHSEDGVDYLNPEEALFLLDAGMMEIYHGGLSMSVQQAYTTLLDATLTLEQYQVFAFLSRYGYILRRHNPHLVLTEYERHLRLDQYTKVAPKKRKHKRKNNDGGDIQNQPDEIEVNPKILKIDESATSQVASAGGCAASADTMTKVVSRSDSMSESASRLLDPNSNSAPWSKSSSRSDSVPRSDPETVQGDSADTNISEDKHNSSPTQEELKPTSRIPYSVWDWTKVNLPNIASKSQITVHRPNLDLLPCCVLYREDSYSFDLDRFRQDRRADNTWEYSLGGTSWKRNIRARNWGEYRVAYRQHVSEYGLETSPAGHLWKGDVVPLVKPEDARSTGSILKKLQIIESVQLSVPPKTLCVELERVSDEYRIMYDVYQPNSKFKKTAEMFPHHHLCIVRFSDRLPSLGETLRLSQRCLPRVPLHFAVVDGGDMNFYVFHDIKLPVDLS